MECSFHFTPSAVVKADRLRELQVLEQRVTASVRADLHHSLEEPNEVLNSLLRMETSVDKDFILTST